MSIHPEHPFAAPAAERDPVRRFRGRMAAPVSIWTSGRLPAAAGWTVSSFLIADGRPAELIGLLDEESPLAEALTGQPRFAVTLLGWRHRGLADAFAGLAPAPGGVFRQGRWIDTEWGPVLADAPAWLGARLIEEPAYAGWGKLIRARVDRVEIDPETADRTLVHLRGRYRAVGE